MVAPNYSGNQTTVTDQAGKARRSVSDALGRLTQVVEDPSVLAYPTNYTYDAQDDLTGAQQGIQARTFSYNSLKQLTNATNPESGTLSYAYDANGNLTSKTDARGITTSYAYDALNRVTSRSYSDLVTPAVNYNYDAVGVANSKGRLTQASSSVSATNYTGYDALGRVTASSQTTNGQTYTLGYGYNLAGGMTSQTYPSGRIVTTSYDAAGRVNAVSGTKTGEANKTYASSISYAPQGAVSVMPLGNGLSESTTFNNRLQPTSIAAGMLLSLVYNYGTSNNNGNVQSQAITAGSFNATQNYGYDALNRLTSASEGTNWTESYGYDQYGNRTNVTVSSQYLPTYAPAPSMDVSNKNRFASSSGFTYDSAGNVTQAPVAPGGATHAFGYDAENKLINFNSGAATYSYDGDGRRVTKAAGTSTTVFVYDATGKLIAEYSNTAATGSGTKYLTADNLGSTRLVTDVSGTVLARHDYLPFGEEISALFGNRSSVAGYNNSDDTRQKFTAKERDSESGLDNFTARYFGSSIGRFMSPDPLAGHTEDPQTLNRYVYVRNNPLNLTDPTGLDFNLSCQEASDTCQKDSNGNLVQGTTTTTTDANGNTTSTFNPTVVTSASLQDPNSGNTGTVNENGVQITSNGQTSQGIFINGTPASDLKGSGELQDFSFHIDSSDEKKGTLSAGEFTFNGNRDQTRETLDQRGAFRSLADKRILGTKSLDEIIFHGNSTQHRFGTGPSPHLSVPDNPKNTVPTHGGFHVDRDAPGAKHLACALLGVGCK